MGGGREGGSVSCFCSFVCGLIAWRALMPGDSGTFSFVMWATGKSFKQRVILN